MYRTPRHPILSRAISTTLVGIWLFALGGFLFSQSNSHGKALGKGKLEAALERLSASMVRPGQTAGVIVQFEDNGTAVDTAEVKNQKKLARRQVIEAAGGSSDKDYDSLPAHSAE